MLVSSKSPTRYASQASWIAMIAEVWNRRSVLKSWATSLTNLWNGNLRNSRSVVFWYLLISLRATVPGLNRWGFLTPPVAGALFLAALVTNCLRGAFPPVDFRAVCLVLAMLKCWRRLFNTYDIAQYLYHYCSTNSRHDATTALVCENVKCAILSSGGPSLRPV